MSDLLRFTIPADFIESRVRLLLPEIAYGYREGWINAKEVINLCTHRLAATCASPTEEAIALLLSDEADQVADLLEREKTGDGDAQAIWRYLTLAWLYEQRDAIGDALGLVEVLYSDFGYPDEMEGFVRYMPPPPGAETGVGALMSRWVEFLRSAEETYRSREHQVPEL